MIVRVRLPSTAAPPRSPADTLFGADSAYDTIVIYAPTGIGKSPINVTLAWLAENAFYTTPQKKLRHQLETDDTLRNHYHVLRGREDYDCEFASRPGWPGLVCGLSGLPRRRACLPELHAGLSILGSKGDCHGG